MTVREMPIPNGSLCKTRYNSSGIIPRRSINAPLNDEAHPDLASRWPSPISRRFLMKKARTISLLFTASLLHAFPVGALVASPLKPFKEPRSPLVLTANPSRVSETRTVEGGFFQKRRVFRAFRRKTKPLSMQTRDQAPDLGVRNTSVGAHSASARYAATLFIDEPSTAAIMPPTIPLIPGIQEKVDTKESASSARLSLMARASRSHLQKAIYERLDRWSQHEHINMNVQCDPSSGVIDLVRGYLRAEVSVDFDRIVFERIRMSKGRIEAHGINLNLWSFSALKGIHRFPDQFNFVAKNVTFTQDDLFESDCIRHGLERLVCNCIRRVGNIRTSKITVDALQVLPNDKVSCLGRVETPFGTHVPFELRSGLSTSARGHALQFPGLEIALGPALGLFVPVLPEIALDLGHSAQILDVKVDGATSSMVLNARCTILPRQTQLHPYSQTHKSFAANFHFDVGKWVTKIGRFSALS